MQSPLNTKRCLKPRFPADLSFYLSLSVVPCFFFLPSYFLCSVSSLIRGDGQNRKEREEVCEEAPQVYHRKEAQAQAHETSIQEEEFIFRYA